MHPYLNIGIQAARKAAKIIARYYEQLDPSKVSEKGLRDLVTIADKAAEQAIIDIILKAYPSHHIIAEESGYHPGLNPQNELSWVIDPLDGTMNFVHGFPQFAVSIGVKLKNQLEHAIIYDPLSHDLFTASRGSGAQLNERRIRVSHQEGLRNALIAADCGYGDGVGTPMPASTIHRMQGLFAQGAETRKNGSAALNLAYVAAGRLDGFFESGLKEWDLAAGILLVREAGGFVSDYASGHECLEKGEVIAGPRKVHEALLQLIQETPAD